MKNKGSFLELNDAFTPTEMRFSECGDTIEFFVDGESIRVQCYRHDDKTKKCDTDRESFKFGFRIPLYASTAIAQMFSQALNGQRLLK